MLNFFDDYSSMFDKLLNSFNRPVKDQDPFSVYTTDKGYVIICNTLGINKNDLRIKLTKEKGNPYPVLSINGETKIEKFNFVNTVNLRLRLNFGDEEITDVSYETKDGLTTIYLKVPKINKKNQTIEAKYIESDDDALNW